MKHFITILILGFSLTPNLHSQSMSYSESVENFHKRTVRDFDEIFFKESKIKVREYYSCPDTIQNDDCKLKRKVYFNSRGQIYSDTSIIDTLISATNRLFDPNKITITRTHPQPSFFKYNYETTVDSLLIDSLERPTKFFQNGVVS